MKNKIKYIQGFTLLEILIAIAVFAIIASLTSSILSQIVQIKDKSSEQISKINDLQLAIALMSKDIKQTVERPVRGNQMHLFPSFIGEKDYLEFTTAGNVNPGSLENRSTMLRVAYLCKNKELIRRTWPVLDSPDRDDYLDTIILKSLQKCKFSYIGMHQRINPTWYQYTLKKDKENMTTPLPQAVRFLGKEDKLGGFKLDFKVS